MTALPVAATVLGMSQAVATPSSLSEPQEEVLCLVGLGQGDCIGTELGGALGELVQAGLVTWVDPTTPILTSAGWDAFDRMCQG